MMKPQFLKVQGHESLVRDSSSGAIIATNDTDYEAYRRSRDALKNQATIIKNQMAEIQTLKNDMQEIKAMISMLIKGN